MRLTIFLILVLCFVALASACSHKCQAKKAAKAKALQEACSAVAGGTKIKLEIDIAGNGGCKPPCKKKKKKQQEEAPEAIVDPPPPNDENTDAPVADPVTDDTTVDVPPQAADV